MAVEARMDLASEIRDAVEKDRKAQRVERQRVQDEDVARCKHVIDSLRSELSRYLEPALQEALYLGYSADTSTPEGEATFGYNGHAIGISYQPTLGAFGVVVTAPNGWVVSGFPARVFGKDLRQAVLLLLSRLGTR